MSYKRLEAWLDLIVAEESVESTDWLGAAGAVEMEGLVGAIVYENE